jgi:hypothetical protein
MDIDQKAPATPKPAAKEAPHSGLAPPRRRMFGDMMDLDDTVTTGFFDTAPTVPSADAAASAEDDSSQFKEIKAAATGSLQARFRQTKALPSQYLVEITVLGTTKAAGNWETMEPAVETRIKITVSDPDFRCSFHGQVMDDIFGTEGSKYDFVAGVRGREIAFPDGLLDIEIELINDPTATNRALKCLENLSKGHLRNTGVDLCHILYGAPPVIAAEDHGALGMSLDEDALKASIGRLEKDYDLNKGQFKAARAFIEEAYTLVWGPAGTGKTKTCAAAVSEISNLGIKQIFACPSNQAVNKALSDCLAINPRLRAVRFVGGYSGGQPKSSLGTNSEESELDETWEMYLDLCDLKEAAHPEHLFHVVKLRKIKEFAALDGHAQNKNAKEYLKLKEQLTDNKIKNKKQLRIDLMGADLPLQEYFLKNCVDAVFVTCSSAPHDDLQGFPAQLVIIDESNQATLADIAMATAPFKETIMSLNLTGDYVQLGLVVTANEANEALNVLNKSHFEKHIKDRGETWPHHMLIEHYRSHPDITAMPNEIFYGKKLVNHSSTLKENGLQKTLRQLFVNLGPAWNQKWRIAIDMSSMGAASERYANTRSVFNNAEANFVVDLCLKMFSFVPVDDGEEPKPEQITAGDVGIFTPYKGQARTIVKKLRAHDIYYSMKGRGKGQQLKFVGTTHGIQGGDANIGITSGVIRDPQDANKHMKFSGNPRNIAVNTTRSRWCDIYVANFGPQVDVINARTQDAYLMYRTMGRYRKMIEWLHNNHSIISSADIEDALLRKEPCQLLTSRYKKQHDFLLGADGFKAKKEAKAAAKKADGGPSGGPPGGGFGTRNKHSGASPSKPDTKHQKGPTKKEAMKQKAADMGMSRTAYGKWLKSEKANAASTADAAPKSNV